MNLNCKYLLSGALAGILALPAFAQTLPLDPAVRTGKLPNGFTYYIRHNEEPKNRVLLYLVNKAGSVLEDEDQRGLAHFMEHMSFNGTKHFPHNELVDYLQKAGIRFGADLNAYTSFDETVYQLPIPSANPKLLKGGLEIMRDWAQEAMLDPAEINKERGVVLEEKRLGKGAGERMQRQTWPVLFNHSRYAQRIPIGLDTVLDHFKRAQIYRFYHDWYRPDLQALVVVGDIDVGAMEKTIKADFGSLKNPAHEKKRPNYTVPLTGKNQFVAVTDKEMTATQLEVIIKHPAAELKTVADYRQAVLTGLFNQMLGERYAELSRQADPPFVQGGAGIAGFLGGLDSYDASVVAKPGELERGFKALWRETERVRRFGFTQSELERAKTAYLDGMEEAVKERDKTNSESYVGEYQRLFLRGEASPGIVAEYRLTKNALAGITLADIGALTKTYIKNTNRDIVIQAPETAKAGLPDETAVNNWLKAVESENLQPYSDKVSNQPLLTVVPVAGKIVSEDKMSSATIRMVLSNGLKVVLKPTNFKNDEIIFNGFAPGGTSLYSDADYQSAANAAGIIAAGGAGNYDPDQLEKFLAGKQLGVQPYIDGRFQGIQGGAVNKDLETALQLVYAYFTEPRKDTAIFNGMIQKSRAGLLNRSADPKNVFNDTVSAVLGNYNVRRTGPSVEKLNQISLERAYTIYKERFADASNFTFTFTGSIDTSTIRPLLEKYLGSLPSTNRHEVAKDLGIHIPAGRLEKTVNKGSEPKASVILVFSGTFDYGPEKNIQLDALKECLEIRLLERLREDESGVYSPGVFASPSKYPEARYSFIIQFGCAPRNVEKLIASTMDEINKLKTSGPPQENVSKWLAEENTAAETELKTNKFWLGYITNQLQNRDDLAEIDSEASLRQKVTPAALQQLTAQYLSGDNYIKLVLMPEK